MLRRPAAVTSLVVGAISVLVASLLACGTEAKGVEACKRIERVRCESAAACGIRRIILGEDSVDVWSPKVLRAGMGAHFLLELYPRTDLAAWRENYRGVVRATALGGVNNRSLYELDLRGDSAWLFGNEGSGVSEAMLQAADGTVHIPMPGATESLNVAMAATVCLFEQMRQRLYEKG